MSTDRSIDYRLQHFSASRAPFGKAAGLSSSRAFLLNWTFAPVDVQLVRRLSWHACQLAPYGCKLELVANITARLLQALAC